MMKTRKISAVVLGLLASAWLGGSIIGCEMLGLSKKETPPPAAPAAPGAVAKKETDKPAAKDKGTTGKVKQKKFVWEGYRPDNKLNPFAPPPPPQLPSELSGADPYELSQLALVGVIKAQNTEDSRIVIMYPDKTTKIFRIGDQLGKMGGVIESINYEMGSTPSENVTYIIVVEKYIKTTPGGKNTSFVVRKRMDLVDTSAKGKKK